MSVTWVCGKCRRCGTVETAEAAQTDHDAITPRCDYLVGVVGIGRVEPDRSPENDKAGAGETDRRAS